VRLFTDGRGADAARHDGVEWCFRQPHSTGPDPFDSPIIDMKTKLTGRNAAIILGGSI
jgi:hypothetical protein